ncbi:MAG: RecQ family zinc-binding domain-containing protein, partial [Bacteroidia bacterium]|nr:RecQ family zinc-binding domain-containing protein [Bacteroidia bacterium]
NGLTLLDRLGVLRLSKEFGRKSMLQFLVSSSVLLKEFEQQQSFSVVGKTILRMYGGVFETANAIDLVLVSKKMGMSVEKVIQILQEMEKQSLIDLKIHQTDASITFLVPREDDKTINPLRDDIERMKSRKQSQVGKVIDYLEDNSHCKQLLLVRYFGEVNDTPCGICSYCKQLEPGENTATIEETSRKILNMVDERPMDSRSIVESLNLDESLVLSVIQLLLDAGKIKLNAINQYFKK